MILTVKLKHDCPCPTVCLCTNFLLAGSLLYSALPTLFMTFFLEVFFIIFLCDFYYFLKGGIWIFLMDL